MISLPRVLAAAIVLMALAWLALAVGGGSAAATVSADEQKVRSVIESAYFNGAFNGLDTEAMAKGFHEDFAIFSARENELSRYEIGTWIEGIEKRKADPGFDPGAYAMEGKIVALDVTGGAASAKIELRRAGKLVYTDYLSLLKFKDGWKISAKVYHRHPE